MKQYRKTRAQAGFTLIELVVVIAILAILAAFALPRFAQLSEQAHEASIRATAGALSAGVALVKAQWVSNGLSGAADNIDGFGNDDVDVGPDGWPTATNDSNSTNMTTGRCQQVWQGVLQANAPTVTARRRNTKSLYRPTVTAVARIVCLPTRRTGRAATSCTMPIPAKSPQTSTKTKTTSLTKTEYKP